MRLQDIQVNPWNLGSSNDDTYTIFTGTTHAFSAPFSWSGTMGYDQSNSTLKFFPKTIGGIGGDHRNIAFYSTLHYKIDTKEISLPSLQSGFKNYGIHAWNDFTTKDNYSTGSSVVLSEVDIRWISQTRDKKWGTAWGTGSSTTDNKFIDTSNITLFDLKTNINKNVATLLAWVDRSISTPTNPTITNLSDFTNAPGTKLQNNQVLYFKDIDVTIACTSSPCTVTGKKTIIIERGNLFINSDMQYATNSVLGIILIGNTANGSKSQLRISEEITNGVGIVYSDGPIVSVKNDGQPIYTWSNLNANSLLNQLYWRGSFATRNTVGWSIKGNQWFCPYGTPDYNNTSTCTMQKAQWYDLIYLRRYGRTSQDDLGVTNNPMSDKMVPLGIDKKLIKIAGGDSYSQVSSNSSTKSQWNLPKPSKNNYNAPLILEYDPQIQTNPPLGFGL